MPSQIIQRRSGNSQLPMANNNSPSPTGKLRSRARRQNSISSYADDRTSLMRWAIIIVLSMSIGLLVWKPVLSVLGLRKQPARDGGRPRFMQSKPLSQFTDLSQYLENSDLVALYFAASWCPMSTPISVALDEAFVNSNELLTPKTNKGEKKSLAIVYVSSDKTKSEFDEYLNSPNRKWNAIPFESEQRNQLKKHFATCAHRELEDLQIDRRHEIPTIIVIDARTQGIITTDGANDISKFGSKALGRWKDKQIWLSNAKEAMTMFH